jgi:hypothetical protein
MKEVQEKLLPGELGVSPRISLLILPHEWGTKGVDHQGPIILINHSSLEV